MSAPGRWDPAEVAVRHLSWLTRFLRPYGPAHWACTAAVTGVALWMMLAA
jgi:hypothetical protein